MKIRILFWVAALSGSTFLSLAVRADSPDASFENNWYEINQKETFHATSQKEWKAIVGERETEEYQVQPGDTLWGLSKTFFGNGYFWPKLWQVNAQFENPHEISPGQTIHLISGGGLAPELSMEDESNENLQTSEQDTDEDLVIAVNDDDEVRVPAEPKGHRVLKEIPRSLPNISRFLTNAKISEAGIYLEKDLPIREDVDVPVPFFATKNEPTVIGQVNGVQGGELSGSWRDIVYLKIDSAKGQEIAPGTIVRSFWDGDALKDPTDHKILGREYYLSGDLAIIGPSNEPGVYEARVRSTLDEVKMGDLISVGHLPRYRISKNDPVVQVPGRVIGLPYRQEGKGEGSSHYVFLNIGAANGLKVNDHLPVYGVSTRLKNNHEIYEPRGEIIVMSVSEHLSTGVVWKSNMLVRVGDWVGELSKKPVQATNDNKDDLLKQ